VEPIHYVRSDFQVFARFHGLFCEKADFWGFVPDFYLRPTSPALLNIFAEMFMINPEDK